MSLPSSTASRRDAARSPFLYALYGAAASLAVAALVAFWLWPRGGEAAGAPGGPPASEFAFGPAAVEVVEAVETIVAEPVRLLGSAVPVRQAVVASEVDGLVNQVLVDEGDRVANGAVLASLDTTTVELDLAAARANRDEAAARLVRFESELGRLTSLLERGAISERELEQALADRDAQVQAVSRFESEAARLEELITRARIVAPFAGQVSEVHTELGEWTARGGPVVTLMDLSRVEVTVQVPERYVSQVEEARRANVEVPVEFDALAGRYTGRVKAVVPQANPQTRTFPVIVSVDNADGRIRGGMFARVLAQVGEPVPIVLVPKDALVLRSGRTFVFRVAPAAPAGGAGQGGAPQGGAPAVSGDSQGSTPGGAEEQAGATRGPAPGAAGDPGGSAAGSGQAPRPVEELEVEIGSGYGAWQAVRGGVRGGDLVVVRGNESLQPGAQVIVAGYAEIAPPPAPSETVPMGANRGGGRGEGDQGGGDRGGADR
jgi:RND family efflux transporter MFP subunit